MSYSCDRNRFTEIQNLDELIKHLRSAFETDCVDIDCINNILTSYKSNSKDWLKYCHFDKYRYTRNLVDRGNGKYNLMILCWSETQESSIHDHSNSHCFMKMLSGTLHEVRYAWPQRQSSQTSLNNENNNTVIMEDNDTESDNNVNSQKQELRQISEFPIYTDDVAYINDSIGLHRVENRSHTIPAVSLHLYCPPFSTCQSFDQRTGRDTQVKVTFYSKYGSRPVYSK